MVQYSLDVFKDKQELVADMTICSEHITRLKSLKVSGASTVEVKHQQESLQENIYKIFIKWKEEWRFVLSFVPEFMTTALATLEATSEEITRDDVVFEMVLDFLRSLTVCISPKRMVRYWPTEVGWLVKLVGWLEMSLEAAAEGAGAEEPRRPNWETLYILLLWLSSAVRTPFDLSRFDDSQVVEEDTLEHRIDHIIKGTVTNYSLLPVVHLLAGAFYSRPDIVRTSSRLERFICLLLVGLKEEKPPTTTVNDRICCLRCLASLLKTVDRTVLQSHVDQIVESVMPLVESSHELLTKLAVKILGRCALTKIRPRLLKWRYNCGKRLIEAKGDHGQPEVLKEIKDTNELLMDDLDEEEDDFDFDELPPYFEALVQICLAHISHPSSVVRWSVAKYLASICSRLPYQFSGDILGHIVTNLCSETEGDLAWHGACLTLAEFVRRGYVRIDFMPKVVEVIEKALFYEQLKGSFSLGTHVRDSAAYICWSMARAYDARLIGTFVDRLAPVLLCTACFDRQLNCRRAASAVIQELSGRTQRFPHWIDVISRTEFHELSAVENTFLGVGVHFAVSYEIFREAIIGVLVKDKTAHWDPAIRRLAAQALGLISKTVPFSTSTYLDLLLERTLEADLNARHGALLALAHLVGSDPSLAPIDPEQGDIWPQMQSLVADLTTRNLFVGIGGDLMRESCLVFIDLYCRRALRDGWIQPERPEVITSWSTLLLSTITTNETDFVQTQSVLAASSLVRILQDGPREHFLTALLGILSRPEAYYAVSTVCKSITQMDIEVLRPHSTSFIQAIVAFIDTVFGSPLRRSETVADAVEAMLWLADRFNGQVDLVYDQLVRCLDDHTITNKGNVGLFVRLAALTCLVPEEGGFLANLEPPKMLRVIQLVAAEALFKRNSSFAVACRKLGELASFVLQRKMQLLLPEVTLLEMAKLMDGDDGAPEELEQYQLLVRLLDCPILCTHLWPGLACVMADPLLEPFTKATIGWLRGSPQPTREAILGTFLVYFTARAKDTRLAIPSLVAAKVLLLRVPTGESFQKSLAAISWSACQGSCNPKKYLLVVDVLCALVPLGGNLPNAFRYLYVLLGHSLPRVRSYTATELFTAMMSVDEDGKLADAVEMLQATDWLVVKDAKAARDAIREIVKSVG